MSVQLSYKDGVLTARLSGEIDHHAAREMREAIDDMDQETFGIYLNYHFTVCEREDLLGITSHGLDIFRTQCQMPKIEGGSL